jgi:hypothetical protein
MTVIKSLKEFFAALLALLCVILLVNGGKNTKKLILHKAHKDRGSYRSML